MRTMLRGKLTLLFMTLGLVLAVPAVALATDTLSADADTIDAVIQGSKSLGTKAPGETINESVDFYLVCGNGGGNAHFNAGNSATVAFNSADSSISPANAGGSVSASNQTINGQTSSWPTDGDNCQSANLTPAVSKVKVGSSQVTLEAPNSPGDYTYTVSYNVNRASGTTVNDLTTTTVQVQFTLTVEQQNTAPTIPGTPTLASNSVTPNQGVFGLTWTASADDQNDPITYRLEHKDADDAGFSNVASNLSDSSYSFTAANKETEGTWLYRVQATDGALSSDFSGNSAAVKVDRSDPTFGACPTAGPFVLNSGNGSQSVGSIQASDPDLLDGSSGSGVNSANSTLSGSVNTSSVGTKNVTFTAVDNAGNQDQKVCSYQVVYDFTGFFRPVDNPGTGATPVFNTAKAGSAIPVKFSLSGNHGLNVLNPSVPQAKAVACPKAMTADAVEETVNASANSFNYDATADQYNYVWKTQSTFAGKCYELNIKLNDGTSHLAYFNFTK